MKHFINQLLAYEASLLNQPGELAEVDRGELRAINKVKTWLAEEFTSKEDSAAHKIRSDYQPTD